MMHLGLWTTSQAIKIHEFKDMNSKIQNNDIGHLIKLNNYNISTTDLPILTKFSTVMHLSPLDPISQ